MTQIKERPIRSHNIPPAQTMITISNNITSPMTSNLKAMTPDSSTDDQIAETRSITNNLLDDRSVISLSPSNVQDLSLPEDENLLLSTSQDIFNKLCVMNKNRKQTKAYINLPPRISKYNNYGFLIPEAAAAAATTISNFANNSLPSDTEVFDSITPLTDIKVSTEVHTHESCINLRPKRSRNYDLELSQETSTDQLSGSTLPSNDSNFGLILPKYRKRLKMTDSYVFSTPNCRADEIFLPCPPVRSKINEDVRIPGCSEDKLLIPMLI